MDRLKSKIRDIPNFPKPGIIFKDITPALREPETLKLAVEGLAAPFRHQSIDAVAGMEARGFILGSLVAYTLGIGFIPLRKPGKLPYESTSIQYDLEYGSAALEIHTDALGHHDRILIVDDLLATGGTAKASCELIERLGGEVVACAFMVELGFLNGRSKLAGWNIHSLIEY